MTECGRRTKTGTPGAKVSLRKCLKLKGVSCGKSLTLVINGDGAVSASIAASGR